MNILFLVDETCPESFEISVNLKYVLSNYFEKKSFTFKTVNSTTLLDDYLYDFVFIDIDVWTFQKELKIENLHSNKSIWISENNEMALLGFEYGIFDFLQKPIQHKRVLSILKKMIPTFRIKDNIKLFKNFQYFQNGNLKNIQWKTNKSKEIFCYLLVNANRDIKKDILIDLFFNNTDIKVAFQQLYTTIYYIRQTLKYELDTISLISRGDSYQLIYDEEDLIIDVNKWDQLIMTTSDHELKLFLFFSYEGNILEEEGYSWCLSMHQKYYLEWRNLTIELFNFYLNINQPYKALTILYSAKHVFPYDEFIIFKIMKICHSLELYNLIHALYNELSNLMENEYDTQPNSKIQAWYRNMLHSEL